MEGYFAGNQSPDKGRRKAKRHARELAMEKERDEAAARERKAWAERDQYLQSNVKLVAAVSKLRAALNALRPFPLVVEPVAASLIAEADAALASKPVTAGERAP